MLWTYTSNASVSQARLLKIGVPVSVKILTNAPTMPRRRITGNSTKSTNQSHVEEGVFITFLTFGDRVTDDSHANESMNGLIVSTQSNIVEGVTLLIHVLLHFDPTIRLIKFIW